MKEQIIYNTANDFMYLKIPDEYNCIYKKLLHSLSTLGVQGLLDCKELKLPYGKNNLTLYSWNMFQIALAAYELKEVEKADAIIQHINSTMIYCCPKIIRKYSRIVYFGDSYEIPTIEEIISGNKADFFKEPTVISPFFKNTHYIAIPKGVGLQYVESTISVGDFLYNRETGYNEYDKKNIKIDGQEYILYFLTYDIPFNTTVSITFIEDMWETNSMIYYNQVDESPNIETILQGKKFDVERENNIFSFEVLKKGHFISIPVGYDIRTIENKSFRGDWTYIPSLEIDFYTRNNIFIDGIEYILWYCEFPIPFNAEIEIVINK